MDGCSIQACWRWHARRCSVGSVVTPKGLGGFGWWGVTQTLECKPQTQPFPRYKCAPSHALEARCERWSSSARGCGMGALSQHRCLGIPGLQGCISSCSQHLLLAGVCVATSWFDTSAGKMAMWEPSWEEMLCMHDGFGVTVASAVRGCLLAPGLAKAARLLLQALMAEWVGVGQASVVVVVQECLCGCGGAGGLRVLLQWWKSMRASVHMVVVVVVHACLCMWWWRSMHASAHVVVVVEVHVCLCSVPCAVHVLAMYCIGEQAFFGADLSRRRDRGWEQLCMVPGHMRLCPISVWDRAPSGLHPAPLCRDRVPQ